MRNITLSLFVSLVLASCSARPAAPNMKDSADDSNATANGDQQTSGDATDSTDKMNADDGSTKEKVEDTAAEMANVSDANLLALTGAQAKQWGNDALGQIEKDFRHANDHLYYEAVDHKQVAFAWGMGVQLHALVAAGKIDDAQALADDLQTHYWCNKNGIWAFNAAADSCGDRYYDDNAWIAKASMELYAINHDAKNLDRAKQITAFSMSGENSGAQAGSIRWHEGDADGQCLCATAPTMVSSLMLYEATKEQKYLDDGKRLYAWVKTNRFGAGPGYRGYENAVIAQGAILLYKNTKDETYLKDARHIGYIMETNYVDVTTHALRETAQWGGHDMTNAYADLYALDGDINWLNIVSGYLNFLHSNLRSTNNRYPENWDKTGNPEAPALLYQASAARAFARFGETAGAYNKLPDPATLFYDCN